MATTTPQPTPLPLAHDDVPPVAFLLPLGLGLLLFAWPTLSGLAGVYRTDGNFSHGFLVPLIAAYAAWRGRHELLPARRQAQVLGIVLLTVGVGVVLFSRWYELALLPRGVIAMFSAGLGLVLVLSGLAWIAVGWRGIKRLRFPLGFLLLGLPIPSFLLHRVTIPLQQLAAVISAAALQAVGILVRRQGSVLQFAEGQLGVDEACSGIRSLAVLTAVVLAMIHFNRPSRRGALILLLAVVPLAVLTNAIRVFVSGVFFALGWKQLTHGGPHELLGLLTFALAIAGLAALSSRLAVPPAPASAPLPPRAPPPPPPSDLRPPPSDLRPPPSDLRPPPSDLRPPISDLRPPISDPRPPISDLCPPTSDPQAPPAPQPSASRLPWDASLPALANAAFGVAFLFFCAAALSLFLNVHYDRLYARDLARLVDRRPLSEFPARVGPYVRINTQDLSAGEFKMLDPSEQNIGVYRGPDGRQFTATILYWEPPAGRPSRRPDLLKRPHSPDWCYPAAGWTRRRQFDDNCPADIFPGELGRVRVFERDGKTLAVLFWTGITAARDGSFDQVFQRLGDMVHSWSHPPLANLHTVSIATLADGDPAQARDAALALARELARILPDYGVGQHPKPAR
jgi:exosortase